MTRFVGGLYPYLSGFLGKGGVLRSGSLLSALELPGSCFARGAANGLSWLETGSG